MMKLSRVSFQADSLDNEEPFNLCFRLMAVLPQLLDTQQ